MPIRYSLRVLINEVSRSAYVGNIVDDKSRQVEVYAEKHQTTNVYGFCTSFLIKKLFPSLLPTFHLRLSSQVAGKGTQLSPRVARMGGRGRGVAGGGRAGRG